MQPLKTFFHFIAVFTFLGGMIHADIGGKIFRDFNQNGTYDDNATFLEVGVSGITVKAYNAAGNVAATATTNADGNYTLGVGAGTYRVEVTGIPDYLKPGTASGAASPIVAQVANGTVDHNVGLNNPSDYCQADPDIFVTRFTKNGRNDGNSGINTVLTFPYTANGTDAPTNISTYADVGSVYGVAHLRKANVTYTAAYFKRHADLGSGGIGAIYKIDHTNGNAVSTFATLPGTDPRSAGAGYDWDHDTAGYASVGKTGIGDIELSDDESTLFAVDMDDRKLYTIPVDSQGNAGAQTGYAIPNPCANETDFRPMGLGYRDGILYVGVTCTAESTVDPDNADDSSTGPRKGDKSQLSAHIYSFDPATHAFSAAPVLDIDLTYDRGCIYSSDISNTDPDTCTYEDKDGVTQPYRANWNPWQMDYDIVFNDKKPGNIGNQNGWIEYMQPLLSDIVFDRDGSMIIQIRDVNGDRGGYDNKSPNPADDTTQNMNGEGDILRACGNPEVGWTLESNGQCGGVTTSGANNKEGPGGGEFYWNDNGPGGTNHSSIGYTGDSGHGDTTTGGMLLVPGYKELVTGAMDVHDYADNGLIWFRNDTGEVAKDGSNEPRKLLISEEDTSKYYGKGSGIGDLEVLCDPAPIEIGNFVWVDTDGDGIQDPGESAIANVTVELWGDTDNDGTVDTKVGESQTDGEGHYLFGGGSDAGMTGGHTLDPVTAYELRIPLNDADLASRIPTTQNVNDPADDLHDSDGDNGVLHAGYATIAYTSGHYGNNDHTLDFGFVEPASLGDTVWYDTDRDGVQDAGEDGVANVTVKLYKDGADTGVTDTTDANGHYLFENLEPGTYHVLFDKTTLPAGYVFTTQDQGGDETKDSDADTTSGATVDTDLAAGENDLDWDAGIYPVADVSLTKEVNQTTAYAGDRVTFTITVHNDGPSVAHNLTVTDAVPNGYENIGDLTGGATLGGSTVSFTAASLAVGASTSFTFQADYKESGEHTNWAEVTAMDEADVDSDPASDHTADDLGDGQADDDEDSATVTTGGKASLGDTVWYDTDRDGVQDAGEDGVANVTVKLYKDGADTGVTDTTDANGHYLFENLEPGTYHVVFDKTTLPAGYVLTAQDQGGDETKDSDADTTSGATVDTDLVAGENDLDWDAGIYLPPSAPATGSWSGSVREDVDNDSVLNDSDDTPIYRVTIVLYRDTNGNGTHETGEAKVASTTTDANGHYRFEDLEVGDYVAVEMQPDGYIDVIENEGGADDDKPDNGVINAIAGHVDAGEDDAKNDFVEEKPETAYRIGDLFWLDTDGNGVYDSGEEVISNAKVELLDTDGNVIRTTTTDENGRYHFDVPAGEYKVRFHIPQSYLNDGYTFVGIVKPGDDTNKVHSDGVVESAVEVGPGMSTEDLTLDAGLVCPCASVTSDSIDSFNAWAALLMILLVWLLGISGIKERA